MNDKDTNEVISLVNWRKKLTITEGIIEDYYWKPLIEILSKDEEETIAFLEGCNDETLYWISEVFEDVSENFQSVTFVEFLKELQKEHPNADMEQDIKFAEYAVQD